MSFAIVVPIHVDIVEVLDPHDNIPLKWGKNKSETFNLTVARANRFGYFRRNWTFWTKLKKIWTEFDITKLD